MNPMSFSGTKNQESLIKFDTSTRYKLWDSGCTHSVNPYFDLYTEYHPLEEGYMKRVNGIGGIIKPKGLGKIYLDLDNDTGDLHHLIFHNVYYFPGEPKILISP